MTDAEVDRFVSGRFSELLRFYDTKAGRNKSRFVVGSIYVIVVSAALGPVASLNWVFAKYVTMVFAPTVAVATGILALYQAQQNWLSYRAAWDSLKREESLWRARVDEYAAADDPNALFVCRVESIAASEGKSWYARQGEKARAPLMPAHPDDARHSPT